MNWSEAYWFLGAQSSHWPCRSPLMASTNPNFRPETLRGWLQDRRQLPNQGPGFRSPRICGRCRPELNSRRGSNSTVDVRLPTGGQVTLIPAPSAQ